MRLLPVIAMTACSAALPLNASASAARLIDNFLCKNFIPAQTNPGMKQQQSDHTLYLETAEQFAFVLQRLARATEANAERRLDLLQDMHLELWKSLSAFDGRCSLKTWVYRVIHNVAASHVHKEKRRPAENVDASELDQLPGGVDLNLLVERDDALAKLHAWIRNLKSTDRQIMTLYLEDLSAAEMSEVTGFKPGAIATRVSRLKTKLAQDFKEAFK